MSGFCFLWDRTGQLGPAGLERLGEIALGRLGHRFAARRTVLRGEGWWLGACSGDGEPQVNVATGGPGSAAVLLSGWMENYEELAAESDAPAPGDRCDDDAGVLLRLLEREGPGGLERARGPLAAFAWEPAAKRLTAVRDHLGERDLCFVDGQGLLMLASEEQALFGHPAVSRAPDFAWLGTFVARMPLPPGRTAFRDVAELAPGESCAWYGSSMLRRRITPRAPESLHREKDREAYVARWREALSFGIPAATRRGRRFGLMLSGGMDSTTAAAFSVPAIRASGREVEACCWRFTRFADGDEGPAIESVANRLGVDVRWLEGDDLYPVLDPETWPTNPNLPQLNPFLRLNLAAYEVARSRGCDVVLNGHFGDYLYPYRFDGLVDAFRLKDGRQAVRELATVVQRKGVAGLWRGPELRHTARRALGRKARCSAPRYLSGQALAAFEPWDEWPPEMATVVHPEQWTNLFGTTCAMENKYEHYFAARAGVDRRHPLRHQRIVECVASLPSFLFFTASRDKALTREAMAGVLPQGVVTGPQTGLLSSLFLHGFFEAGRGALESLLSARNGLWPEVIARDFVERALANGREATAEEQRVLLAAAGLELWHRAVLG